jgi:hypothetical protein
MIMEFSDKLQTGAHSRFQAWRRENSDGFFLTEKSKGRFILHHVDCWHPGKNTWEPADAGQSLTKKRKICSTEDSELDDWATQQGFSVRDCQHCVGYDDPPAANPAATPIA